MSPFGPIREFLRLVYPLEAHFRQAVEDDYADSAQWEEYARELSEKGWSKKGPPYLRTVQMARSIEGELRAAHGKAVGAVRHIHANHAPRWLERLDKIL